MRSERHNQNTLADLLDITQAHLSRLMSDERTWTMPVAMKLFVVTGLPVERFLSKEDAGILKLYVNRLKSDGGFLKDKANVA